MHPWKIWFPKIASLKKYGGENFWLWYKQDQGSKAPSAVHYVSFYTVQALMHWALSAGFDFYQQTLSSINWHWPPSADFIVKIVVKIIVKIIVKIVVKIIIKYCQKLSNIVKIIVKYRQNYCQISSKLSSNIVKIIIKVLRKQNY